MNIDYEIAAQGMLSALANGVSEAEIDSAIRAAGHDQHVRRIGTEMLIVVGLARTARVIVVTLFRQDRFSPKWWVHIVRPLRDDEYDEFWRLTR